MADALPVTVTSNTRLKHPLSHGFKDIDVCSLTKKRGDCLLNRLVSRHMAAASSLTPSQRLVQQMTNGLRGEMKVIPSVKITQPYQILECPSCEGFMNKPICLPCGHSLCKSCLEKPSDSHKNTATCSCCKKSFNKIPIGFQSYRSPTVLLQNFSVKWYPCLLQCCTIREEGNKMAHDQNLAAAAILEYAKALETGISDHRVLSNRSKVYLSMGQLQLALKDAETCCFVRPQWPKGHYRRGVVLEHLHRLHEAAASYLLCVYFRNDQDQPITSLLQNTTKKLLSIYSDECELVSSVVRIAKQQLEVFLAAPSVKQSLSIDQDAIDIGDFECVLCGSLLYRPVTVPCGHTFCQSCLARTFDHTPYCPVCRSPLGETFYQHTENSGKILVDLVLTNLIQFCFPQEYNDRSVLIEQALLKGSRIGIHDDEDIPIFVCTMAYPGMPCPLHIFEPRYRLMIRRCIDNNSRRFGMCLDINEQSSSYADIGTVLFISSLEFTPDGRSLVTTLGEKRFRVLDRNSSDGYAVARIRFLSDEQVVGTDNINNLRSLQTSVYDHAMKWFHALPAYTRTMIIQNACIPPPAIDPTPENCPNGPKWIWWFVNIVPTSSSQTKLTFLSLTSLRERLLLLRETLPLPSITSGHTP